MDQPVFKIKIYQEQDRLDVCSILAKNGYKVWIGKEPKATNKKATEYYVYFQVQGPMPDTLEVTT